MRGREGVLVLRPGESSVAPRVVARSSVVEERVFRSFPGYGLKAFRPSCVRERPDLALDVLGGGRPDRQQEQSEHLREDQVQQLPQRHAGMMSVDNPNLTTASTMP